MRIRTLVLISLTAVLATNVHNANVQKQVVSLPVSQYQISANAPQKVSPISLERGAKVATFATYEDSIDKTNRTSKTSRSEIRVLINVDKNANQLFAKTFMESQYAWGEDQFICLVNLWNRESGWRENALNTSSGAYGIPQSLPGSKMATFGDDWKTNPETQIKWGLNYIQHRYDTPCGAWGSFSKKGWY